MNLSVLLSVHPSANAKMLPVKAILRKLVAAIAANSRKKAHRVVRLANDLVPYLEFLVDRIAISEI